MGEITPSPPGVIPGEDPGPILPPMQGDSWVPACAGMTPGGWGATEAPAVAGMTWWVGPDGACPEVCDVAVSPFVIFGCQTRQSRWTVGDRRRGRLGPRIKSADAGRGGGASGPPPPLDGGPRHSSIALMACSPPLPRGQALKSLHWSNFAFGTARSPASGRGAPTVGSADQVRG